MASRSSHELQTTSFGLNGAPDGLEQVGSYLGPFAAPARVGATVACLDDVVRSGPARVTVLEDSGRRTIRKLLMHLLHKRPRLGGVVEADEKTLG